MDNVLRAVEANWVVLVSIGLLASLLGSLITTPFRQRVKASTRENERGNEPLSSSQEAELAAVLGTSNYNRPEFEIAMAHVLEAERRKSFWPNLWLNLFTNFVTNLIFFILGVVVTLYLSHPH